jgi:hypothetical protein
MIVERDLDEVRERLKSLSIFDHDGYSGPATRDFTVTVRDGRFLIVGADDGSEWHDSVESVVEYIRSHQR